MLPQNDKGGKRSEWFFVTALLRMTSAEDELKLLWGVRNLQQGLKLCRLRRCHLIFINQLFRLVCIFYRNTPHAVFERVQPLQHFIGRARKIVIAELITIFVRLQHNGKRPVMRTSARNVKDFERRSILAFKHIFLKKKYAFSFSFLLISSTNSSSSDNLITITHFS